MSQSKRHSPISFVFLFSISIAIQGCVYLNPMVDRVPRVTPLEKPQKTSEENNIANLKLVNLNNALIEIDKATQSLERKRNSNIRTGRALDIATFGLITGAVGYGIHSGHTNAIKNLSFAGGASYVASNLFASNQHSLIYDAGIRSLSCISMKGEVLYALVSKYDFIKNIRSDNLNCKPDATNKDLHLRALNAKKKAFRTLEIAESNDLVAANQITSATQNVINTLNEEILKSSPSPDAVINAARSLIGYSGMTSSEEISKAEQENIIKGVNIIEACDSSILEKEVAIYEPIAKSIDDAINSLDTLKDSCQFFPTQVADVTLSQSELTIKSGLSFNIIISGGRAPYSYVVLNPDDGLKTQLIGNTLIVSAFKAPISKTPITLTVRDSSSISKKKDLVINYIN